MTHSAATHPPRGKPSGERRRGDHLKKIERIVTHSPAETRALAGRLVREIEAPLVLALHGALGSGKTCFVQGLAVALGVRQPVTSPTFTIIHEYPGRLPLYHVDLYRIRDADEALALGIEDYLPADGITAVEWAERAAAIIPAQAWHLHFAPGTGAGDRVIRIARGPKQA